MGVDFAVFGDIDIEEHRRWVERVCSSIKIEAYEPLWKQRRRTLLEEFIQFGFKAIIISVKEELMDRSYLVSIQKWPFSSISASNCGVGCSEY